MGVHSTHVTRISMDASTFDEICMNCGATDEVPGGWGRLAYECPKPEAKVSRCCQKPVVTNSGEPDWGQPSCSKCGRLTGTPLHD